MNIDSERKYLPIFRNASKGYGRDEFRGLIGPLFDEFLSSGQESDEYKGWAFSIKFTRTRGGEESGDWLYASQGKDDYSFRIPGRGIINIHLESWLWFK